MQGARQNGRRTEEELREILRGVVWDDSKKPSFPAGACEHLWWYRTRRGRSRTDGRPNKPAGALNSRHY